MVNIRAFPGIRPKPEYAKAVASKPYDVLSSAEAREEAKDLPYSFLRVVKSEITLPEDVDVHSQQVYDRARQNFYNLLEQGIMKQDDGDRLYVYRQEWKQYSQTGLVATSSVEDYLNDTIKKHEHTRPVKEQDRIDHMRTTGLHSGPVFLTYRDVADIDTIIYGITAREPVNNFVAADGVRHVLWVIDDASTIASLTGLFAAQVPASYIADGHHRAASSAKVAKALREAKGNYTGAERFNWFLSVLFPASQLNIIDYNRVVADLNGLNTDAFLTKVKEKFTLDPIGEAYCPPVRHHFGMYLAGQWYGLKAKDGTFPEGDPVHSLDVDILQQNLLGPVLGIDDPRTNDRIDFVGGIRGLGELEKRVKSGEMAVAFALHPVSIEELMRISDTGMVMPPKSTWFEPKLRSGLVVHRFQV